ncbi:SDR family NAD(P)-dependent oxidoreductase [Kribbella sp. NPDC050820]|uniref:SDR family NAD(P)-dependent oxidoreductase n=1 Tax=Kribbella sp. NPDC050820 TaxID=3155408 RepID=UPI0033F227D6
MNDRTSGTPDITVVTGAAGGIGSITVRMLLERGDHVVATDMSEPGLSSLRTELGGLSRRLHVMTHDVTNAGDWTRVCEETQDRFGPATILVNNAGISPKRDGVRVPGLEVSREEWDSVLAVNLTGSFLGIQAFAGAMKQAGYGRIVNLSSIAARNGGKVAGVAYAAAKSGIIGLTRAFSNELAPHGITVNAVAPGRINAGMVNMVSDEVNARFLATVPVGRLGDPCDIARTIAFLTDRGAGYITGTTVDVNGGLYMS